MERRHTSRNTRSARSGLLQAAIAVLLLGGAGGANAQEPAGEFQEIPVVVQPESAALAPDTATAAPAPAPAGDGKFDYAAIDLRVGVWTGRAADEVYRKGDAMTVGFQTNADAYAVVYHIDAEGRVTVLWPRSRMDDGFVFGGHEYQLPVQGGPALRAAQVEGEGFVEAVVSRYPFDLRALQLDFHHEPTAEPVDFRVVGDPFLAINEVNFAITGLENAEDHVVTNYAAYYVHREVDHPRYLCGQCHFDDGPQYDPYGDTCSLNISVDYRWNNGWWSSYGYYPVYYNPCYVYVDPWTWRPWVNFWYDPWWCAPAVSVCYWPTPCYPWYDSPYYGGDCYTGNNGKPRYAPLNPNGQGGDGTRTKTREYGPITPMLAAGGAGASRGAATLDARTAYKGEPRATRSAPTIGDAVRTRSTAGLRIREGGSVRGGTSGAQDRVRHTAAGARTPASLVPVSSEPTGGGQRLRTPGTVGGAQQRAQVEQRSRTRSGAEGRAITPVAPRQKGTRIWNTGRSGGSDGTRRPEQVRPGGRSGGSDSSRDGAVRERSNGNGGNSGSRSSGGDTRTRSGGSSGGSGKATRGGGGSGGSSGGRSSGDSGSGGQSRGGSSAGGGSGRRGG